MARGGRAEDRRLYEQAEDEARARRVMGGSGARGALGLAEAVTGDDPEATIVIRL